MRYIRMMLVLMAVITGVSMFAGEARASTCGVRVCANADIGTLYLNSTGHIYIRLEADYAGLDCTPVSNAYIVLNRDHANYNQIYALLLSAELAGRPVSVRMTNADATCNVSYVTLR